MHMASREHQNDVEPQYGAVATVNLSVKPTSFEFGQEMLPVVEIVCFLLPRQLLLLISFTNFFERFLSKKSIMEEVLIHNHEVFQDLMTNESTSNNRVQKPKRSILLAKAEILITMLRP